MSNTLPTIERWGDLTGRRVLVRVDFNAPVAEIDGVTTLTDDFRLRSSLPTIDALIERGATVVLCTHFGRPDGRVDERYSVAPLRRALDALRPGQIWLEMSTTDHAEVLRVGALVEARGGLVMDCPVSGGCHRAATGNIAIFAGGRRATFERVLPVLTTMGRRILHTGDLGSASRLKVVTNYLCTVHLAALAEALTVCSVAGLDMNTAYEAIRISSGNSPSSPTPIFPPSRC